MNNFEKYNKIHDEVMKRLEDGEYTTEMAKEVNDLAFEKYITESIFNRNKEQKTVKQNKDDKRDKKENAKPSIELIDNLDNRVFEFKKIGQKCFNIHNKCQQLNKYYQETFNSPYNTFDVETYIKTCDNLQCFEPYWSKDIRKNWINELTNPKSDLNKNTIIAKKYISICENFLKNPKDDKYKTDRNLIYELERACSLLRGNATLQAVHFVEQTYKTSKKIPSMSEINQYIQTIDIVKSNLNTRKEALNKLYNNNPKLRKDKKILEIINKKQSGNLLFDSEQVEQTINKLTNSNKE